jgi:hypothetical protein
MLKNNSAATFSVSDMTARGQGPFTPLRGEPDGEQQELSPPTTTRMQTIGGLQAQLDTAKERVLKAQEAGARKLEKAQNAHAATVTKLQAKLACTDQGGAQRQGDRIDCRSLETYYSGVDSSRARRQGGRRHQAKSTRARCWGGC